MTNKGALSHLSVFDASESIGGQYCGRLFSDYGANTILAEPSDGSLMRKMEPFSKSDGQSLLFLHLNFGKRSIVWDSDFEKGLPPEAANADVALLPAGADHAGLRQANPRLITCTISDFGEDGPRRHWKGGEMVHQALSGVMYRNGDPVREPLFGCGWRSYYVAGIAAYTAILAAVFARVKTGKGQHCAIDVAECAASMTYALATQFNYNHVPELRSMPVNLPSGVLRCRDGWVSVFVYAYRWEDTCTALKVPELIDDPRFKTAEGRMDNWKEIIHAFQESTKELACETVVERLQALGCVAGKASRPSELATNEHLAARDYWEQVQTQTGPHLMLGPPFRMEKTPRVLRQATDPSEQGQAI